MYDPEKERGRRLLKSLLPWARAEAKRGDISFETVSSLAKASSSFLTEDHLDALLVYRAPKGGWHGDLVFRNVPPGFPNAMGTPVANPKATRADAEEAAKRVLVMVLLIIARNKAEAVTPKAPVFMIEDWSLKLLPDMYEEALKMMPQFREPWKSKQVAQDQFKAVLDRLCPNGFNGDEFGKWANARKAELMAAVHIAALNGVYAYPFREDEAPPTHSDEEISKAKH